jgi:hypothetical protein
MGTKGQKFTPVRWDVAIWKEDRKGEKVKIMRISSFGSFDVQTSMTLIGEKLTRLLERIYRAEQRKAKREGIRLVEARASSTVILQPDRYIHARENRFFVLVED